MEALGLSFVVVECRVTPGEVDIGVVREGRRSVLTDDDHADSNLYLDSHQKISVFLDKFDLAERRSHGVESL